MKRSDLKLWTIFLNKAKSLTLVYAEDDYRVHVITDKGSTYDITKGKNGNEDSIIWDYHTVEGVTVKEFINKVRVN